MARWKTHNRRAAKKRRMPYARFRQLRKAARLGLMYGMGTQKLVEPFRQMGMTVRDADFHLDNFRTSLSRIAGYPLPPIPSPDFGTVSGRTVSPGPGPQWQIPKTEKFE